MSKKTIIASRNPVKIEAVRAGFEKMFPKEKFEFEGVSVPSEVSDQPMSHSETLLGAKNRALNAKLAFAKADFWVGVEGGIEKFEGEGEAFAWVYILGASPDGKSRIGRAKTGSFFLPKKIMDLVESGMELGDADDVVFGQSNSKQKNGAVGLLTDNVMNRKSLYEPAVVLALIPFLNPKFY